LPVEAEAHKGAQIKARDFYADRPLWQRLQKNGMKADVSWTASAARYAELYRSIAPDN
ncbi:MAG: starch synthase, partial [Bauldia litoralis]